MTYVYDGTFSGFLCCVYESYVNREDPLFFRTPEEGELTLLPERQVFTDPAHWTRVYDSLDRRISPTARRLVEDGFLTCMEERERALLELIRLGYEAGPSVTRRLQDERVYRVFRAVRALRNEAEQYRGFVRFSEFDGMLAGEIEPKNRVLSLIAPFFHARLCGETFLLFDRTHREALLHSRGRWRILADVSFQMERADERERQYRQLWTRFYDTVAIAQRENPVCRRTHMPKRFWDQLTELQPENRVTPSSPASGRSPVVPAGRSVPGIPPVPGRTAPGSDPGNSAGG